MPVSHEGQRSQTWRIHGELLKLGFEVAQSSVAKYMTKRPASCPCKVLIGSGVIPRIG